VIHVMAFGDHVGAHVQWQFCHLEIQEIQTHWERWCDHRYCL